MSARRGPETRAISFYVANQRARLGLVRDYLGSPDDPAA